MHWGDWNPPTKPSKKPCKNQGAGQFARGTNATQMWWSSRGKKKGILPPKKKQRKNKKWAESTEESRKDPREVREVRASALAAHGPLSVSLASCRPSSPPRKKAWRVPHENQASHCRSSGKKGEEKKHFVFTLSVLPNKN